MKLDKKQSKRIGIKASKVLSLAELHSLTLTTYEIKTLCSIVSQVNNDYILTDQQAIFVHNMSDRVRRWVREASLGSLLAVEIKTPRA